MDTVRETTFAGRVKDEVLQVTGKDADVMCGELRAIYDFSGENDLADTGIACRIDSGRVARKVFTLLKKAYNINGVLSLYKSRRTGKGGYEVRIAEKEDADRFFNAIGNEMPDDIEVSRAYIRGAFLAAGTVSDPLAMAEMLCRHRRCIERATDLQGRRA